MNPEYVNPIKILVCVTLFFAIVKLSPQNKIHRYATAILFVCFTLEVTNSLLLFFNKRTGFFTTICSIFFNTLWLAILAEKVTYKKTIYALIVLYIAIGAVNLLFFEGLANFNYYTFVIGAFMYLSAFIYESFSQLKKESFSFFQSNHYLLLVSPVILMLGLSFMFGFKSRVITSTLIFSQVKLYNFVTYFVNIIFYAIVNLYIYKEKRKNYAV